MLECNICFVIFHINKLTSSIVVASKKAKGRGCILFEKLIPVYYIIAINSWPGYYNIAHNIYQASSSLP